MERAPIQRCSCGTCSVITTQSAIDYPMCVNVCVSVVNVGCMLTMCFKVKLIVIQIYQVPPYLCGGGRPMRPSVLEGGFKWYLTSF